MLIRIWAALVSMEPKASLKPSWVHLWERVFEDHATYFDILPRASDCFVKTLCVLPTRSTPGQGRCSLQISLPVYWVLLSRSLAGSRSEVRIYLLYSVFLGPQERRALGVEEWIVFWRGLQPSLDLNGLENWGLFSETLFSSSEDKLLLDLARPVCKWAKWRGHVRSDATVAISVFKEKRCADESKI